MDATQDYGPTSHEPEDEDLVRLWWWNPGQGATSERICRDDLDVVRAELRARGCVTWVTGARPYLVG